MHVASIRLGVACVARWTHRPCKFFFSEKSLEGGSGKGYMGGGVRQARADRYGSTINLDVLLRVRVLLGSILV
jgi:hypothetical protein